MVCKKCAPQEEEGLKTCRGALKLRLVDGRFFWHLFWTKIEVSRRARGRDFFVLN